MFSKGVSNQGFEGVQPVRQIFRNKKPFQYSKARAADWLLKGWKVPPRLHLWISRWITVPGHRNMGSKLWATGRGCCSYPCRWNEDDKISFYFLLWKYCWKWMVELCTILKSMEAWNCKRNQKSGWFLYFWSYIVMWSSPSCKFHPQHGQQVSFAVQGEGAWCVCINIFSQITQGVSTAITLNPTCCFPLHSVLRCPLYEAAIRLPKQPWVVQNHRDNRTALRFIPKDARCL